MHDTLLADDTLYHVCVRSVAGLTTFRSEDDYRQMTDAVLHYAGAGPEENSRCAAGDSRLVRVLAYCIVPGRMHLILQQRKRNGVAHCLEGALAGYARYFKARYGLSSSVWEEGYKSVPVETNEQLLHLTRYIHLTPVRVSLAGNPAEWPYSSCREYLGLVPDGASLCQFSHCMDIDPNHYGRFVADESGCLRELNNIRHLLLE